VAVLMLGKKVKVHVGRDLGGQGKIHVIRCGGLQWYSYHELHKVAEVHKLIGLYAPH
jgi:hypothetical protein